MPIVEPLPKHTYSLFGLMINYAHLFDNSRLNHTKTHGLFEYRVLIMKWQKHVFYVKPIISTVSLMSYCVIMPDQYAASNGLEF